jgi:tetratricopeptide (TPR) repeat protein
MRHFVLLAALCAAPGCCCFDQAATSIVDGLIVWGATVAGTEGNIAGLERMLSLQPDVRAAREVQLADALAAYRREPTEETAIWVGRRLAYLGLHETAVAWYGVLQLDDYRDSYRVRRHGGHRLITLRQPAAAEADLQRARELALGQPDEVEPDGMPNELGIPTSTTQGNIDYHLALALYLQGRFDEAAEAWRRCVDVWATNDDSRVAAGHWLCASLRRAGCEKEFAAALAGLPVAPAVIENFAYQDLVDLHAGRKSADELLASAREPVQDATRTYGVARWLIDHPGATPDEVERGTALLRDLAARGPWESFGRIAAESDLGLHPEPQAWSFRARDTE